MKVIALKFTTKELELLASLVADQLFRREFIDPKMPGYKSNAEEISLGKALMGRLRFSLNLETSKRPASPQKAFGKDTHAI